MKTLRVAAFLSGVALAVSMGRAAQEPGGADLEPTYRSACQWWSELPKKWTPVGWRNHLFRYDVLFNGAVVAEPHMNRRTAQWAGQGMLLWPSVADPADDGTIQQGWRTDHEAPVLWTDWGRSAFGDAHPAGVSLRQEVFAHLPDAETPLIGHMVKVANQLAKQEGIFEKGYRLVISCGKEGGQVVPHLHMHLLGGRTMPVGLA